jgi:hypothetical protein
VIPDLVLTPDTLDEVASLILAAAGAALDSVPFPDFQPGGPCEPRFLGAGEIAWGTTNGGLAVCFVKVALGGPGREKFDEPSPGDGWWAMQWAQFSVQVCQQWPVIETSPIAGARFPAAPVMTGASEKAFAPGWTVFQALGALASMQALLGDPGTSLGMREALVGPLVPHGPQGGLLVMETMVWVNLVG